MDPEKSKSSKSEAEAMLSAANDAATASAEQSEAPRFFVLLASSVSAAIFSLWGVIDPGIWYWSLLLYVPLGIWLGLELPKRPKSRIPLRHSGKYMLAALCLILAMQLSSFWVPGDPALVAAKFAALLAIFWIVFSAMRKESITNRIIDGHERSA